MKNKTSKATLNQFMRGSNLINVTFMVKYLMKNKTSKAILNKFMRGGGSKIRKNGPTSFMDGP